MHLGVQVKLTLLMILLMAVSLAGFFTIKYFQIERAEQLYNEIRKEKINDLDKILDLNDKLFRTLARDYSLWDDMVRFARTGDPKWGRENVNVGLTTYDTDAAWVYNKDLSLVYHYVEAPVDIPRGIPLSRDKMASLFAQSRFCHFFIKIPAGLMEVHGATIHPTSDISRSADPQGYFLVAVLWNGDFLNKLSSIYESSLHLQDEPENEIPGHFQGEELGKVSFSKALPGWDGKPITHLHAITESGVINIREIAASSNRQLLAVLMIDIFLLIVLSLLLLAWVSRPLHLISRSLSTQDVSSVEKLKSNKTEFGGIARLIITFFEQKKELENEVTERKKAQEALTASQYALERMVDERTAELKAANTALELEIKEHRRAKAEKEKLLTRLLRSEKLAALGQMGGSIAHEIRNPLTAIWGFAQNLLKDMKNDHEMYVPLKIINDEAKRTVTFLEQLQSFSRTERIEKSKCGLNKIIGEALLVVKAEAKVANIELITKLAPALPEVLLNRTQVQQLVINICTNSIEAMPKGGTLKVATAALVKDGRNFVELRIEDTGHGMTEEVKARIFEPFFTTKEEGKGGGLGLALVNEIIEKHGGYIDAESTAGLGTTFNIQLPVDGPGQITRQ